MEPEFETPAPACDFLTPNRQDTDESSCVDTEICTKRSAQNARGLRITAHGPALLAIIGARDAVAGTSGTFRVGTAIGAKRSARAGLRSSVLGMVVGARRLAAEAGCAHPGRLSDCFGVRRARRV